jgi:hypothetical protein
MSTARRSTKQMKHMAYSLFMSFFLDEKERKNQERMTLNGAPNHDHSSVLYAILSALFLSEFALTLQL